MIYTYDISGPFSIFADSENNCNEFICKVDIKVVMEACLKQLLFKRISQQFT